MTELNIVLAATGLLILVTGLVSRLIQRSWLSVPLLALATGVVLGPRLLGLVDPAKWGDEHLILEEAARITLAIGLMGVALRLPPNYFLDRWRSVAVLLALVMPLMWLASGALVYLLLGIPWWAALLVGAVVTPTDPIVASSMVTGQTAERNLPGRLRHLLSAESGANDGLAYLFVLLPILVLAHPPHEALPHWLTHTLLREVGGGLLAGVLIGLAAGYLFRKADKHHTMEVSSFLAYTLALSLLTLGAAKLLGTDGILAVFVAGVAFDSVASSRERAEEEKVQEAVNLFFTLPIFALIGATIPLDLWLALGWKGPAVVAALLLLRRLPALLLALPLTRDLRSLTDALFLGWFGPIGVSTLFYAMLALRKAGVQEAWAVGSLVICASILVHGVTATPFTRLYGRYTGHRARHDAKEKEKQKEEGEGGDGKAGAQAAP